MSGIFDKALFWLQAKNRHGIHSPFVYDFLDRGLYTLEQQQRKSQNRLLHAALAYFRPEKIWSSEMGANHAGMEEFLNPDADGHGTPWDFFVFEDPSQAIKVLLSNTHLWHNDSIVYIGNLRASGPAHEMWREITGHASIQVVLETYREGLLFFRTQQAKQYFKIRT